MNDERIKYPDIYVISLKRAETRRAQMRKESERLKRSGYAGKIRFFDAVDAKAGEHKAFPNYNEFLANIFGAPLTDGERACFASHYLLWEKLAKEDKPDAACIIIEDDVEFAVDFQKAVKHCVDSSLECVRLAVIEDLSARRKNVGQGEVFFTAKRGGGGTQGYFLRNPAAEKFLRAARRWTHPVDLFMDRYWQHGVAYVFHFPYAVHAVEIESEIDKTDTVKRTISRRHFILRPLRYLARLADKIQKRAARKRFSRSFWGRTGTRL